MSTHDTAVGFGATALAPWAEAQLVAELRVHSEAAFDDLVTRYHAPLFRFVCRIVGDPDQSADILQEVFLKVFRGAARFEGKSSLKTWLYQIALHEASNHQRWWRRHKRQETSLEIEDENGSRLLDRLSDGGASPLLEALRGEQRSLVQQALAQVSEPFRSALVLREIEGFSYGEISEILQVRVGTVKSRLLRGREMLRQVLMRHSEHLTTCRVGQESV